MLGWKLQGQDLNLETKSTALDSQTGSLHVLTSQDQHHSPALLGLGGQGQAESTQEFHMDTWTGGASQAQSCPKPLENP